MKVPEQERRDWFLIPFILAIGFLFVIIAGQWALRFSPRWKLNANMESNLDPNSDFLTQRPNGFFEPVDASVLTQHPWIDLFLTPGAAFATGTPLHAMTATPTATRAAPTIVLSPTNTAVMMATPTSTFRFIPSTPSLTPKPKNTKGPLATGTSSATQMPTFGPTATGTPTATTTSTSVFTPTPTAPQPATATPTSTATATASATPTGTPTATPTMTSTPTNTPVPIPTDPTPAEIGTTPDGVIYNLPAGATLTLGINLVVNGHAGWDLVYYERPAGSGVFLDWVIVEISDGNKWYTVFDWGNNIADTNTNMDFNILSNPQVPAEPDQRDILAAELYNSTGIAINLDGVVPPGTYSYIRFTAPPGDVDNKMEIDAIQVLP
jgi:hypothetical protein